MSQPTSPGSKPAGPGTAWSLVRLAASLLVELASNGIRMVFFLFQRGAYRRRIKDLLLKPHAPASPREGRYRSVRAAAVAGCALIALLGCCGSGIYRGGGRQPGTDFSKEIDETVDSIVTIATMPDWEDSLMSDLENIVSDDPCLIDESFELWGW
jgi:hypothetical protein